MIPGNHDIVDFNGMDTSLDVFDSIENISVIKETGVLYNAGFVPYKRSGISDDIKVRAGAKSEGWSEVTAIA